jgi:hypothetical protein
VSNRHNALLQWHHTASHVKRWLHNLQTISQRAPHSLVFHHPHKPAALLGTPATKNCSSSTASTDIQVPGLLVCQHTHILHDVISSVRKAPVLRSNPMLSCTSFLTHEYAAVQTAVVATVHSKGYVLTCTKLDVLRSRSHGCAFTCSCWATTATIQEAPCS